MDLVSRCQLEINIDGAKTVVKKDLLSKEKIVSLGLESSKRLQAENYGYAPEEVKLRSIEPVSIVLVKLIVAYKATAYSIRPLSDGGKDFSFITKSSHNTFHCSFPGVKQV